ncbi:hypothetical protein D4R99_00535 [bacterium]|nr:MAG: hypothetical protein D4R99_00535 [bacterium]
MKEKNKKMRITTAAVFSVLLFSISQSVLAEEITASSTPVIFTVSVGKISCLNGEGKASVSLTNEPTEGGYYEVYGDMITKNNITLNRKVDLPTGTYTWKGFANNHYAVSGISEGTFTVGKCAVAPVTSQTLKGAEQPSAIKKVENTETEKVEVLKPSEEKFTNASSSETATTSPDVLPKEKKSNEIIGGLLLLVAVFAFFGFRNRRPKQEKEV